MLGIEYRNFRTFGTGKHNFGYIPDPPEPEETECTDEYVEGSCECCDHFEQCKQVWKRDTE